MQQTVFHTAEKAAVLEVSWGLLGPPLIILKHRSLDKGARQWKLEAAATQTTPATPAAPAAESGRRRGGPAFIAQRNQDDMSLNGQIPSTAAEDAEKKSEPTAQSRRKSSKKRKKKRRKKRRGKRKRRREQEKKSRGRDEGAVVSLQQRWQSSPMSIHMCIHDLYALASHTGEAVDTLSTGLRQNAILTPQPLQRRAISSTGVLKNAPPKTQRQK